MYPMYPIPPPLFPPPPSSKRANTLLLKHSLVHLLSPQDGHAYWSLLCNLITARITRQEFDQGWEDQLAHTPPAISGQLDLLHHALLLSILYNTCTPTLPPASVSHQGWTSMRKRGEAAMLAEGGQDPLGLIARKRRKLKRLVQGMTKAEKKRLREVKVKEGDEEGQGDKAAKDNKNPSTRSLGLYPPSAGLLKTSLTASAQQEHLRVQAVPSALESQYLPDLQTLTDRMSAVAYASGRSAPVDPQAARLASVALDIYLKDILSALLGMAQSSSRINTTNNNNNNNSVITRTHLSALLQVQPSLFHAPHLTSIERFITAETLYEQSETREDRIAKMESAQMESAKKKER
ncbi:MAG: hypothetical protein CYPHOPRED_002891, partial [Cyphobasidiales sp. Tagirdzhanova-0007]